jgi:hypothetical protein
MNNTYRILEQTFGTYQVGQDADGDELPFWNKIKSADRNLFTIKKLSIQFKNTFILSFTLSLQIGHSLDSYFGSHVEQIAKCLQGTKRIVEDSSIQIAHAPVVDCSILSREWSVTVSPKDFNNPIQRLNFTAVVTMPT